MTGDSLNYKKISVYRLDSTIKYTRNKLIATEINHIPKVQYAWDQAKIYKAVSIL